MHETSARGVGGSTTAVSRRGLAVLALVQAVVLAAALLTACGPRGAGDPTAATAPGGRAASTASADSADGGGAPTDAAPADGEATTAPGAPQDEAAADAAAAPGLPTPPPPPAGGAVLTGADVLVAEDMARLHGRRVGIIANQTSRSGGSFMIDLLHAHPAVDLVAIFAPEHGVRGEVFGGDGVDDTVDPTTGVPIRSLYQPGSDFTPTQEDLAAIDVLVYDLQDVGTRFYTFISTMGRAMEAASRAGVTFMVLDRPNPQGGDVVEGAIRTPDNDSFVSEFPIPARYGLTAGELALMIRGEGWKDTAALDLQVVPMAGWTRDMRWGDTGREWVPPSFGLPTAETALIYPGTVLFETMTLSFGGGTTEPFVRIGAPWVDAEGVAAELNSRGLPGVRFTPITYVPEPHPERPQYADRIGFLGEEVHSVRVDITDEDALRSVAVGIHMVDAFRGHSIAEGRGEAISRGPFFDLLAGTDRVRDGLVAGRSAADLVAESLADAAAFDLQRQPYLIY